jgi:hypothetical protein
VTWPPVRLAALAECRQPASLMSTNMETLKATAASHKTFLTSIATATEFKTMM